MSTLPVLPFDTKPDFLRKKENKSDISLSLELYPLTIWHFYRWKLSKHKPQRQTKRLLLVNLPLTTNPFQIEINIKWNLIKLQVAHLKMELVDFSTSVTCFHLNTVTILCLFRSLLYLNWCFWGRPELLCWLTEGCWERLHNDKHSEGQCKEQCLSVACACCVFNHTWALFWKYRYILTDQQHLGIQFSPCRFIWRLVFHWTAPAL